MALVGGLTEPLKGMGLIWVVVVSSVVFGWWVVLVSSKEIVVRLVGGLSEPLRGFR